MADPLLIKISEEALKVATSGATDDSTEVVSEDEGVTTLELHDSVWVGCRRRPEHWVGTQLNIGSVSLSNTKRLLTCCLHSSMQGVGFTNVCIFYVFFCLFGIRS